MENIMLQDEKKLKIKIVDFGLGNLYDDENPLKTQCGSPEYAAPELFVKGKKYGPEVDLWSFGVILYVMGAGRVPFVSPRDGQTSSEERRRRLMAQINRGLTEPQERLIAHLSIDFKSLLKRLLTPAADKRIGIRELCNHPWIIGQPRLAAMPPLKLPDHDVIVDELMILTDMSRRDLEMEINNQRFGEVGGMYNILAHEIQLDGLNYARNMPNSKIKNVNHHLNLSYLQCNNYSLKSVFGRPMTQPCPRRVSAPVQSSHNASTRPVSGQRNRVKPIVDFLYTTAPKKVRMDPCTSKRRDYLIPAVSRQFRTTNDTQLDSMYVDRGDVGPNNHRVIRKKSPKGGPDVSETKMGMKDVIKTFKSHVTSLESMTMAKHSKGKESGNSRQYLKKPRNLIKNLDKFKWKGCIFHQENAENEA